MNNNFNPNNLRLGNAGAPVPIIRRLQVRDTFRPSRRFLKGPIPLPWLAKAATGPGKSLAVAIALWHLAGMRGRNDLSLGNKLLGEFGVDRNAKYRALRWLKGAGLIATQQQPGRNPLVSIRDLRIEDADED